ncbi:MAG TPA: hypothetical protein VND64_26495 [Pirellulales bacterium]|nr:hypothetical protein [Pirellulales bacterium]
MPHELFEWQERIKAVEREHSATRLATERLLAEVERDPTILALESTIRVRDVRFASERLDGTYIIRLFAEFETGLRLCWNVIRGRDPPNRTRDLLDGVAASRRIPHDVLSQSHVVREYRNALIHERDELPAKIAISDARGRLCRFFSFLPPDW